MTSALQILSFDPQAQFWDGLKEISGNLGPVIIIKKLSPSEPIDKGFVPGLGFKKVYSILPVQLVAW